MYILLILSLLFHSAAGQAESNDRDPFVGEWIGQYQTKQALSSVN